MRAGARSAPEGGMNGINLIPASRSARRRQHTRLRMWIAIVPTCALLLLGMYGVLSLCWETGTEDLTAKQTALTAGVESAKKSIHRGNAAVKQATVTLWANRAMSE